MSLNLTVIINRFRRSTGVGLMKSAFLPSDSMYFIYLCIYFIFLFVCNFLFFCLPTFLDLFVSGPRGQVSDRGCSRWSLPQASNGVSGSETGSVTLCGALSSPPLIESSDPKLMRGGTGAHLLSAEDVLHRQAAEPQWQCWIRSVGSDTPLQLPPPHPSISWYLTYYLQFS